MWIWVKELFKSLNKWSMNNKPILLSQILQYKCFFFDFDGVILESANIKTEAFIELYSGSGFEEQIKEYHLKNQGISRFVKFRWITEQLLQKTISEKEVLNLGEKFSTIVFEKILKTPFVPGIERLLKELKQAGKYLVIASGTPQEELDLIVQKRNLGPFFQEVYGSPSQKKDIVAQTMFNHNFEVNECLFFGDASTDFEAAITNKIHFFTRYTAALANYWQEHVAEFVASDFEAII